MFPVSLLWCFVFISPWWIFSAAQESLQEREVKSNENYEILAKTVTKNGSYAHVECDSELLDKELSCKVVRGKLFDVETFTETGKCSFEKKRKRNTNVDKSLNMKIESFNNGDNAVVSWSETTGVTIYQHVVAVNFLKSTCIPLVFDQKSSGTLYLNESIVYESGSFFEVLTSDKKACTMQQGGWLLLREKSIGTCRRRYDENGNPKKEMEEFNSDMHYFRLMPVSPTGAADGFFAYGWTKYDENSLKLEYVSESGKIKKSIATGIAGSRHSLLISTSNAHETVSLCAYDSTSVGELRCYQYPSRDLANMNPNPDFKHRYDKKIETLSAMNLLDGKILVTTVQSDDERRIVMMLHEQNVKEIELFNHKMNPECENMEIKTTEHDDLLCSYVLCNANKNLVRGFRACVPN